MAKGSARIGAAGTFYAAADRDVSGLQTQGVKTYAELTALAPATKNKWSRSATNKPG
jgi:hypothetical protein